MLVRNLFLILLPVFIFRNLFLNENRSSLFLRFASSQHSSYIRAIPVMSLLRILLEGDHGFSIRYSPMTYQHAPRQRVHLVYNVGR
jgi:hypothetical protein